MISKRTAGLISLSTIGVLVLTGCGQAPWEDTLRDLEGVTVYDPAETVIWNNIDGHPNIARLCLDGVAFATTTRPDMSAVTRIPEWDAHCKPLGPGKKMS